MHIRPSEPMCADHNVDRARSQPFECLPCFGRTHQPGKRANLEGILSKAGRKTTSVLFGQHGGGHKHRHLMPCINGLECSPHRQLRFTEAHIAAEQPIHRLWLLHISPNGLDRRELIRSLVVGKRSLKVVLPLGVFRKSHAGPAFATGLQPQHVGGHIRDCLSHGLLLLLPGAAANLGKSGGEFGAPHILLHQVDAGGGHIDPCALGKLHIEKLLGAVLLLQQFQSAVAANAVRNMHDIVAILQIQKRVDRPRQAVFGGTANNVLAAKQLRGADQHQFLAHQPEACRQVPDCKMQPPFLRWTTRGKQFTEAMCFRFCWADDPHLLVTAHIFEFFFDTIQHTGEPLHTFDRQLRGRFKARRGHAGERDGRPAVDAGKHVFGIRNIAQALMEPGMTATSLLGEFHRLDQCERRAFGQNLCQLRRSMRLGECRHLHSVEVVHTPLTDDVEGAE